MVPTGKNLLGGRLGLVGSCSFSLGETGDESDLGETGFELIGGEIVSVERAFEVESDLGEVADASEVLGDTGVVIIVLGCFYIQMNKTNPFSNYL